MHREGGFADYRHRAGGNLNVVPETLTDFEAAFAEPVAIGVQGCRRGMVTADDTVLVLGAGPIGLAIVEVARARGAKVYATDISAERLATAADLGATPIAGGDGLLERVLELTNGEGMPVVMEATGAVAAMEQTIDLVAAGGRIVILGLVKKGHGRHLPRPRLHPQGSDDPRLARLGRLFPGGARPARLGQDPLPEDRQLLRARRSAGRLRQTRRQSDGPAQGRLRFGGRMKLVTFSHRTGGDHHAGVLDGDQVACLTEAGIAGSVLEIVAGRRGGARRASAPASPRRRAIRLPT